MSLTMSDEHIAESAVGKEREQRQRGLSNRSKLGEQVVSSLVLEKTKSQSWVRSERALSANVRSLSLGKGIGGPQAELKAEKHLFPLLYKSLPFSYLNNISDTHWSNFLAGKLIVLKTSDLDVLVLSHLVSNRLIGG